MDNGARRWWETLCIRHKVWSVLLLCCVPLAAILLAHLYFLQQFIDTEALRHDLVLAERKLTAVSRLVLDIEAGLRRYSLTGEPTSVAPLIGAEKALEQALNDAKQALASVPTWSDPRDRAALDDLGAEPERLSEVRARHGDRGPAHFASPEWLQLSDSLRHDVRTVESLLEQRRTALDARAEEVSRRAYAGLWLALAAVVGLGWFGSRSLARALSDPIARLRQTAADLGDAVESGRPVELPAIPVDARDEFGELGAAYLGMAKRIRAHIREIEVLDAIGHQINTIGPDGVEGVLRRITDRAVELVQADACLVLLRNNQMGCWIVEAASGEWNERLKKSVMLWEEFPVSVRAYETREPAIGDRLRSDDRPQVVRRNLIGDSMLAIPLLAQGVPFGVLSLLSERPRSQHDWNQRLAKGLAQEAALAISNARLYDAAEQKQQRLEARVRELEHLAETMAHDLKGPGERTVELATLLVRQCAGRLDEKTTRWLDLIRDNGRELVRRVEGLLEVARVGIGHGSVTTVEPAGVIANVLDARSREIARLRASIKVEQGLPRVACHGAYLRQIFDNLVSNALKYARPGHPPFIAISAGVEENMARFSVRDEGIGIPADQRSRVFEPFVRLEPSAADGCGIGLAIVQRIVELYGGKVWIEDVDGAGCTVNFTLPCFLGLASDTPGASTQDISGVPDPVTVSKSA
ncbi:MAG TPA: ATP-binding protein [Nitrospira sp.]|nr:ATP-binding protein [Nitrospira sp.]